jgi:hypothetical protein
MIARVDPCQRCYRTEFPDRRLGDLRVVHDVGIIRHPDFEQDAPRAEAVGSTAGSVESILPAIGSVHPQLGKDHWRPLVFDVLDDRIMTDA